MNSKEYFNGDELAASVWEGKYAAEGESNPDNMHKRLAKEFARIEESYLKNNEPIEIVATKHSNLSNYGKSRSFLTEESIYELFKNFKYIVPQGSIMSMLGVDKIGSLSNCFVIGQPEDSYGGILQKDEQLVQLMKRRGGVGIDISTLRPSGTDVTNAAKTSTGAASFMERFSNSTREVAQGGRRGALMITIDVRHPDVFEFVNIKKDRTKVTGANISVMLRDDFMEAVKNDEDYYLRFPCDIDDVSAGNELSKPYNELINCTDQNGNILHQTKRIKAKELYDAIVENAWENAEPGQMFIDRHWDYSPDGAYEQYKGVTTNPCGEIFMQPYDACRLMAINLLSFVENPYTDEAYVDWVKLYEVAYEQQRLADDLVDLELEHISRILAKIHSDEESDEVKRTEIELWEKVYDVASAGRRTGCGFTALGDMLAAVGVAYDSQQGCDYIEKVMHTKMEAELDCTIDLAILRGAFEGWNVHDEFLDLGEDSPALSKGLNGFYEMMLNDFVEQTLRMAKFGRRNVSWSTVAPTGSVSILTQTTSGLEPLFAPYYMRRKKVNPGEEGVRVDFVDQNGDNWMEYPVLHPQFKEWVRIAFEMNDEGMQRLTDKDTVDSLVKKSPWYKSCAPDIDWKKRVDVQAIIQKYTSHSISSTINLPNDVTKEEVAEIYIHSYDKGLKGVTVYRDGCRTGVLVTDSNESKETFEYNDAPKRPTCLPVEIHTTVSKGIKWNVIVGIFDSKPYEVFAIPHFTNETELELCKIKRGRYDLLKDGDTYSENITSQITDEQDVLTRMVSTALRHGADITFIVEQLNKSHGDITSFSKAIARTLKKYIDEKKMVSRAACTECGSNNVVFEEGCLMCKDCGSSKCS
jgi:ribonucleoside-diphosphate reductase alpha chain